MRDGLQNNEKIIVGKLPEHKRGNFPSCRMPAVVNQPLYSNFMVNDVFNKFNEILLQSVYIDEM